MFLAVYLASFIAVLMPMEKRRSVAILARTSLPIASSLYACSNTATYPSEQGLTLVPISAQLELTLPLAAQLKYTLSPI